MCLIGIVVAIVVGFILSLPARRISGFYLAMITLFAAILVPTIASSLSITGGINGISLISNKVMASKLLVKCLLKPSQGGSTR